MNFRSEKGMFGVFLKNPRHGPNYDAKSVIIQIVTKSKGMISWGVHRTGFSLALETKARIISIYNLFTKTKFTRINQYHSDSQASLQGIYLKVTL